MDSAFNRPSVRRVGSFAESVDRRDNGRQAGIGEIVMFWHHDPSQVCRYCTLDMSESGARVRSEAEILEGLTGVVMELQPGDVQVERTAMVVWSRAIRDAEGHLSHHETGLRFL